MYKILLLLSWILLSDSSSYRFSDDTYDDDDSLWTLSRNYRNEIENEVGEIKGVGKEIDIKMPDVSPQKVRVYILSHYTVFVFF